MFKYLIVGGHFGDNPKKSGYIEKLFSHLSSINPNGILLNGGKYEELHCILTKTKTYYSYDVIFWMPDISNNRPKLVQTIKIVSPHCILITSKNNLENKYGFMELVARALQVKANLFVEFTQEDNSERTICAGVYDPLGNGYCKTSNISRVAITLIERIQKLLRYTRVKSKYCDWEDFKTEPDVSDEFYSLIRKYADVFHKHIHGTDTSRLLGNASFRCERGFPSFKDESFKDGHQIFVSRRNIDKRYIEPGNFVPVALAFQKDKPFVAYQSENKPSVDTPIQILLYHYYHNMKYMIHSHVYIQETLFTKEVIPCGAIEEFYEIISIHPEQEHTFIKLNLKGHGSLVMAKDIDNLRDIEYLPRTIPEWI